jgi:iron complex outermembrane receptor protein
MLRTGCCRFLIPFVVFGLVPLTSLAQNATFNLPAQPLAESLRALGAQTGLNIMVSPPLVDGKQAPALKANLSAKDALAKLLAGTKLEYHFVNDQTVVIRQKSEAVAASDPPAAQPSSAPSQDTTKEAGKNTSQDFRVAQVDQATAGPQAVEEKKERKELQEVVVTGSRIPTKVGQGAQEVKVYSAQQIEQSGQTTLANFLNTLPEVSTSFTEFPGQGNQTTVQLRGLPIGTTLLLLNGRRIGLTGEAANGGLVLFDLNNIPTAAIERIEVIPQGSSAIYGSDALAGVVNIILKSNFSGIQADAHYGSASDTDEVGGSLALGKDWQSASLSAILSYYHRSALLGADRAIENNPDFTSIGGPDDRITTCNPGNVYSSTGGNLPGLSSPYAAIPTGISGVPTIGDFRATAGTLNKCSMFSGIDLIPETTRSGIFVNGKMQLSDNLELFTEIMFSHLEQSQNILGQTLSQVTLPATNPYNPFGQNVLLDYQFSNPSTAQRLPLTTDFLRPLLGLRGAIGSDWHWEVSLWNAHDSDSNPDYNYAVNPTTLATALSSASASTAFNPFTTGNPLPQAELGSLFLSDPSVHYVGQTTTANGFVQGSPFQLPSGAFNLVLGSEYERDRLREDDPGFGNVATFNRTQYSFFTEARVPVLGNGILGSNELTLSAAVRYDHSDDFGGHTTPQYGIEWRPFNMLRLRGAFAKAYRAPGLSYVNAPTTQFTGFVQDPLRGNTQTAVTEFIGGNPALQPELGQSKSLSLDWNSHAIDGLRASATVWSIDQTDRVAFLFAQTLVDNASLFPGRVVRGPPGPNGEPGPIESVNLAWVNFGALHVSGIDGDLGYSVRTRVGQVSASVAVTDIDRYQAAIAPGAPVTSRLSMASIDAFAPRWKGTATLGWTRGPYGVTVDGRYVGRYQDYAPLPDGQVNWLGNFWLADASVRYELGQSFSSKASALKGTYLSVGAVNLFNSLPKYSAYPFYAYYDPSEYDIRGRFVYFNVGIRR